MQASRAKFSSLFSIKFYIVNILDLAGHTDSAATSQLCRSV